MGSLVFAKPFEDLIGEQIALYNYQIYSIELRHIVVLSRLAQHHKDPFDRLIIAQALVDNLPVVSIDIAFDLYAINRIW